MKPLVKNTSKKDEILLTKEEISKIRNKVNNNLKKFKQFKIYKDFAVHGIFCGNNFEKTSNLLKSKVNQAAKYLKVSEESIVIDTSMFDNYFISIGANIEESKETFEKRKEKIINENIKVQNNKKKAKLLKLQQIKEKKKKTLIKLVGEFGDSIYDIFEEIQKTKPI